MTYFARAKLVAWTFFPPLNRTANQLLGILNHYIIPDMCGQALQELYLKSPLAFSGCGWQRTEDSI